MPFQSKHEGKQRKERCYFKVNAVISNVKIYVVFNHPSNSYVGQVYFFNYRIKIERSLFKEGRNGSCFPLTGF